MMKASIGTGGRVELSVRRGNPPENHRPQGPDVVSICPGNASLNLWGDQIAGIRRRSGAETSILAYHIRHPTNVIPSAPSRPTLDYVCNFHCTLTSIHPFFPKLQRMSMLTAFEAHPPLYSQFTSEVMILPFIGFILGKLLLGPVVSVTSGNREDAGFCGRS